MEIWFTARRRFDPSFGPGWDEYIKWSGLTHLVEVCSMDPALNPSMFWELTDEDWQHNIHENHHISYFCDAEYVIHRMRTEVQFANVPAIAREPASVPVFGDKRFSFCGYDLVDDESSVSALTNCGGFDEAFSTSDLSKIGLLDHYEFAREVQNRLRLHYPDEQQADCILWAVWRLDKNAIT